MGLDEVGLGRDGSLTGRMGYASVGQGRLAGRSRVGSMRFATAQHEVGEDEGWRGCLPV